MRRVREADRIFADETILPTLAPGTGKTKTAYLWAYARDDRPFGGDGPPMVVYHFEDSRAGNCVDRHLGGYSGILQVDGYGAYRHLEKPVLGRERRDRARGCWAHVRRKFFELHANGESEVATLTVERMKALWAVDDGVHGATPEIRAPPAVGFRHRSSTTCSICGIGTFRGCRRNPSSPKPFATRSPAGGHWSASSTTAASSSTATSSNAPSVLSASPGRSSVRRLGRRGANWRHRHACCRPRR